MAELLLLTGFLGSGKTTLLVRLLETPGRTGVIINEFGAVGVDGAAVRRGGLEMRELNNGSVFCACIKADFTAALIELSRLPLDRVIVEASGLADPASMEAVLAAIAPLTERPYSYIGSVAVADAETLTMQLELLPAVERQLRYAGAIIVNKADAADPAPAAEAARRVNPGAAIYTAVRCEVDCERLLAAMAEPPAPEESLNTEAGRPKAFTLRSAAPVSREELAALIAALAPSAYRIKGFALTFDGLTAVSAVGRRVELSPAPEGAPAEIAVISSVGIRMLSLIAAALKPLGGRIGL